MSNKNNTQSLYINKMIQSVIEENYAEADKYLKAVVQGKLLQRMAKHKNKNIFTNKQQ